MNDLWKKVGSVLALMAVLTLSGAHWAVLQSVAWSRMLIDYSEEFGIQEGVSRTFDGEHPCPMCCSIQKSVAKETAPPSSSLERAAPSVRILTVLQSCPAELPRTGLGQHAMQDALSWAPCMLEKPPVPPPRNLS